MHTRQDTELVTQKQAKNEPGACGYVCVSRK